MQIAIGKKLAVNLKSGTDLVIPTPNNDAYVCRLKPSPSETINESWKKSQVICNINSFIILHAQVFDVLNFLSYPLFYKIWERYTVHIRSQSEIMLRLSFQRPSSVFRDRFQTSSACALPIIMRIHQKRDIIMRILQNNAYSPIRIIVERTHYTCFTH